MRLAIVQIIATTCLALLAFGCSSNNREQKKAAQPTPTPDGSSSGGFRTDTCTASNCPEISFSVTVNGQSQQFVTVTPNQSIFWAFAAQPDFGSRQLVVFNATSIPKPSGMTITGAYSNQVRVQWTPTNNDPQSGTMNLSIRDVTRCETLNNASSGAINTNCNDYSRTTQADTMRTISWTIRDNNNQFQPNGNSVAGNNGNAWMTVLPAIFQVLTGEQTLVEILPTIGSAFTRGPATVGYGTTPVTGYNSNIYNNSYNQNLYNPNSQYPNGTNSFYDYGY